MWVPAKELVGRWDGVTEYSTAASLAGHWENQKGRWKDRKTVDEMVDKTAALLDGSMAAPRAG